MLNKVARTEYYGGCLHGLLEIIATPKHKVKYRFEEDGSAACFMTTCRAIYFHYRKILQLMNASFFFQSMHQIIQIIQPLMLSRQIWIMHVKTLTSRSKCRRSGVLLVFVFFQSDQLILVKLYIELVQPARPLNNNPRLAKTVINSF